MSQAELAAEEALRRAALQGATYVHLGAIIREVTRAIDEYAATITAGKRNWISHLQDENAKLAKQVVEMEAFLKSDDADCYFCDGIGTRSVPATCGCCSESEPCEECNGSGRAWDVFQKRQQEKKR